MKDLADKALASDDVKVPSTYSPHMRTYSNYGERPPCKCECVPKKSKVNRAGYIPAKTQIQNLLNAGKTLVDWRNKEYPGPVDEDGTIAADHTIDKGYEVFDYVDDMNHVQQQNERRATRQRAAAAKVKADEKSKDLGATPPNPANPPPAGAAVPPVTT